MNSRTNSGAVPAQCALSTLQRELRQRLAHNEAYLSQSIGTRIFASSLSFGAGQGEQWIAGEESAIRTENEWIRVLLAAPKR